jgi:hypothetical protein
MDTTGDSYIFNQEWEQEHARLAGLAAQFAADAATAPRRI